MSAATNSPLLADALSAPPCSSVSNPDIYSTVPIFNRRADLLALTIPFMVFSWVCSALRLYVRFVVLRAPGWDDVFLVFALLSTTVSSTVLCIAPDFGFGRPLCTLTFSETQDLLKIMYIGNFPYPLTVAFIKIGLLFQYLRIFKEGSRHSLICKWLIAFIIIWGLVYAVCSWAPCIPLAAYWDLSITDAKCWGFGSRQLSEFMLLFVSQAITTSLLDLVVFILPASLYFKPTTQKKTRIALLCLFALGLGVILCSVWRMAFVIQLSTVPDAEFDPTWYSPTAAGLANLEAHLAVACAALPVFWPSLERTWSKIRVMVTHEVCVTNEYGQFSFRSNHDVEMQSTPSDTNLTLDAANMPEGWEPFVGDETTGLGESETVIEVKESRKVFRGTSKQSRLKVSEVLSHSS